jgi:hypothetical protein
VRNHGVLVTVHDQAGRRAGREEGKVVEVGGRRNGNEALDLGPPHQELHADPRTEREARDPARTRLGIDRLRPVKRRSRVGQFAKTVIECTLTTSHATEVEADRGKTTVHKSIVELIDDLMVHRAAELRVRMKHDGNRRVLLRRWVVPGFDPAGGTGENDFRHGLARPRSTYEGAGKTAPGWLGCA